MALEIRQATEADVAGLIAHRRNKTPTGETLLGDALADTDNQFWFVLADGDDIGGWARTQLYAAEEGVVSHPGWYLRRVYLLREHRTQEWRDALWGAVAGELAGRQIASVLTITLSDFTPWGFETVALGVSFDHPDLPRGARKPSYKLMRADAPYVIPSP